MSNTFNGKTDAENLEAVIVYPSGRQFHNAPGSEVKAPTVQLCYQAVKQGRPKKTPAVFYAPVSHLNLVSTLRAQVEQRLKAQLFEIKWDLGNGKPLIFHPGNSVIASEVKNGVRYVINCDLETFASKLAYADLWMRQQTVGPEVLEG